jgi:PAS domain S-box-containing protein
VAPALLLHQVDRTHLGAALLTVTFAAFTLRLHRRGHLDLVAQHRALASLERSDLESRRQNQFLDALFASVPNALAVVDQQAVCLSVNPGFEALFGFSPEEVVGRRLIEVLVPAESVEDADDVRLRVIQGETVVSEGSRRRKDGTMVTIRVSAAPVAGEAPGRILLLYTDMTVIRETERAMRAAQARLELVLASSNAIIYAMRLDQAGITTTWVSENLPRLTGYSVAESMAPDWWVGNLHPEDHDRVLATQSGLMTEGHLSAEYRFRQKDGSFRWLRDEARLIRDDAGAPSEVVGTWVDITDFKQAQATMQEGRDLAEQSARSRTEFLANMSHEIRTPLNAVLGLTELLLDSELTAEQGHSLRLVQAAGESLLTLLNDILDLSKIEAEYLALESIPFDLRYLLESTASLLAVRVADQDIEMVVDVDAEVPHMLIGDPTRLRQVLSNLVGNALKFTERGEVVLSAAVAGGEPERPLIRFAVRDTGVGIPLDKQQAIFEQFTQADASMTRKYGGTGLGLSIARKLVALMGGELSLRSEVGRGSEFFFSIPVAADQERPAAAGATGLAGHRVLVVDDNATNRRIVREMLRPAGVIVEEAATAAAGLDALRQTIREGRPYSLALIDAQMPGQDGFGLAAAVRADPALTATVRLMMLTSAGQRGDTQRCREIGIEAYLMKPISRGDLITAVSTLLGAGPTAPLAEVLTRHTLAESRPHLRILLAEDNMVNQMVAAAMLRKRGHIVTLVNNGREAVDAVAGGGPFDVVLMDIQMPELDGFAATHEIRALPGGATLPIIALTAHALTGERERCLAQGMNGYVPKPFRPQELFAAVEELGSLPPLDAVTPGPPPEAAPVDLVAFRRTMREAGAGEAVDSILDLFVEHAPQRLTALAGAVRVGDAVAIGRAAHAFRSPSGSIGAYRLELLLRDIEEAANAGDLVRAGAAFDRVEPEVEAVLSCLRLDKGLHPIG